MIRDRGTLWCVKCGGPHISGACERRSRAPVETPGHNGPYRGTAPVRTVPPGLMGEQWKNPKAYTGLTTGTKLFTYTCACCGAQAQSARRDAKFCKRLCRSRGYEARRKKRKRVR